MLSETCIRARGPGQLSLLRLSKTEEDVARSTPMGSVHLFEGVVLPWLRCHYDFAAGVEPFLLCPFVEDTVMGNVLVL